MDFTMETDLNLESALAQIGPFGKYQLRQHVLHMATAFLAGLHIMTLTFTAPILDSRCDIPEVQLANASSMETQLEKYIPLDSNGKLDTCSKFKTVGNLTFTNETVTCEGKYFYNSTYYRTSRVIDWSMVCDKRWMRALLQSIYMVGLLVGSLVMGRLADMFGRKPALCICGILEVLFSSTCAFVPNYEVYAVLLFLYGTFGSSQAYNAGFVLTMELVEVKRRTICGVMFSVTYAFGVMVASFWAWLITDVKYLQVVYAMHSCLLLAHWWFLDESIRWLWGKGRKEEALKILSKAVQINGNQVSRENQENCAKAGNPRETEENTKFTMKNLFVLKNLRNRTVILAFCSFANSLVYYGLSFSSSSLPGNPFFMNFLNGAFELPGHLFVIWFLDKLGRRMLQSCSQLVAGVACIAIAFVSQDTWVVVVALFAKLACSAAFAITYNYTAEMFPTVVRNSVIGIISMTSSVAGTIDPGILMLDQIGKAIPTVIFGAFSVVAALLTLFLPETNNQDLPQTVQDGENFAKGDTAFRHFSRWFLGKIRK